MNQQQVTEILAALQNGQADASDRLIALVYDELRRLAQQKMASEANHTLQPTALVHEVYLRLVSDREARWANRGHFFAAAAEAMRRILIEAARRRASQKRGGGRQRLPLADEMLLDETTTPEDVLSLDESLRKLQREDADAYRLVMLRYFGGLSVEETAEALGISPRTVKRHWSFARAWLQREIEAR